MGSLHPPVPRAIADSHVTTSSPPSQQRVAIVPDFAEPYDLQILAGISEYVRARGHWSLYVPSDPLHAVAMLENWSGDGVVANFDNPAIASVVRNKGVPAVGFGGGTGFTTRQICYLATDDHAIGKLGAEHLLDRGFERFGYCAMPNSTRFQPWSRHRCQAFQDAIAEAGYRSSVFHASASVSLDWQQLLDALCQWLESLEPPVGVMAAYDMRALHVLEACRRLRLRIPDQVAVLGVDNHQVVCELADPQLSSIIQGGFQVGRRAAELLDEMMAGKRGGGQTHTIAPVGVVTRHSTDVLAIEDEDVVTAIRMIRQGACQGIQVKDIVNAASIARVTLEKRFKAVLGRTMHAEIKRVQMERVKELLRTTDLPMHKIASRTGFEYVEYLSNSFRQLHGMTPGQYRKQNRE